MYAEKRILVSDKGTNAKTKLIIFRNIQKQNNDTAIRITVPLKRNHIPFLQATNTIQKSSLGVQISLLF